jgi:hypothetical protein
MIVTSDLDSFERKTFKVKAVRITAGNIREIAEWTDGDYEWPENGAQFVRIPCGSKKDNCRAYSGDWVTCLIHYNDSEPPEEPNFRVYKEHTFLQAFLKIMGEAEKYARVHELLMKIRSAQDKATYYGDTSDEVLLLVDKTAHEICKIV